MILSIAIIKGGTGKTSTAAALAQAAAYRGIKALAIDLDPQGDLTFCLGADPTRPGSYQLLHGADPAQLIQHTAQGIDVIAAGPDLATEKTTTGSAKRLKAALQPIRAQYDFVVIDTPPQMGELTYNALEASTGLIVPLEADTHSLQGLYQITDIVRQLQRRNQDLQIAGAIITRYDGRPNINRYLLQTIKEKAEEMGVPFLAAIRAGVPIREAQALQQSLFEYAPKSKPAQDYIELFDKLTK